MDETQIMELRKKYGVPETGYSPNSQALDSVNENRMATLDAAWGKPDKTSGSALREAFQKRGAKNEAIKAMDFTEGGQYEVTPTYEDLAKGSRQIANFAGGVADVAEATPVLGDVIQKGTEIGGKILKKGVDVLRGTKPGTAIESSVRAYIESLPDEFKERASDLVKQELEKPNVQEGIEAGTDLLRGIGTVEGAKLAGDATLGLGRAGVKGVKNVNKRILEGRPEQAIEKDIQSYTEKALAPRGSKTTGQLATNTAKKVEGIKLLEKEAPNIDIINEDGIAEKFNLKKATFADTVQAVAKTKNKIVQDMSEQLKKAGESGIEVDTTPAITFLEEQAKSGIDRETRTQAQNLLDDIVDFQKIHGNDPAKLHDFIQLKNKKLSAGYRSGTVDPVTAEATELLRNSLDDVVERTAYGKEYGAIKAIEQDIVREAQRLARQKGSGLEGFADTFGNIDLIMAFVQGNPALAAKGLATKLYFKALRASKSPELMLQKAFGAVEELGKKKVRMGELEAKRVIEANK